MKQSKTDKSTLNINLIILFVMLLGVFSLFILQSYFAIHISLLVYLGWVIVCLFAYGLASHEKDTNSSDFDFYKATEPVTPQQIKKKKYNTEERIGISISQDGLDPMVIFKEDKSGVATIVKLHGLPAINKLMEYFAELDITSHQLGSPIESRTLLRIKFERAKAFCRLTDDDETQTVEFAFPKNSIGIYQQVLKAIQMLMEEYSDLEVLEVNVLNYQTLVKFYNYVERLSAPENRCIEYISYYKGNLKICNSSYVELYDCTLQSTLTSWINRNGLIQTDNVDLERGEQIHLENIDLPYNESRLVNIKMGKPEPDQVAVTLCLTFAEIVDDELTGNQSGFALTMQDDHIEIKQDKIPDEEFLSIKEYFEEKCYSKLS